MNVQWNQLRLLSRVIDINIYLWERKKDRREWKRERERESMGVGGPHTFFFGHVTQRERTWMKEKKDRKKWSWGGKWGRQG